MFEATGLAARELAQKLKAGLGKTSLKAVPSSQEKFPKIGINQRFLVNTKAASIKKRSEYDLFHRPDEVVIVE